MTVKIDRPDPARIYVAMTSATTQHGNFRRGERRRGDDPAVVGTPSLWAPDGVTESEERALWTARFPDRPVSER